MKQTFKYEENKENLNMETVKCELEIELSHEDIDDIMSGALDSGITYWCRKAKVVGEYLGEYACEQISRGGAIDLYDMESNEVYRLTREKFLKGIKMWAEKPVGCDCLVKTGGKLKIECCNADDVVCDAIIQYAIFGDIIYA